MRLYGALHIVCQHIYVHSIAFSAPSGIGPPGSHHLKFNLLIYSNQGAKGIGPIICAYSFSVCRFRFVRYVLSVYVGLGLKLHTCILFTVYVHYIFMNATSYTRYYLFSVQVNQYFYSVPIIQFSLSVPVQQVQCFCQYRYFSIQL